jgi:hypothetical protein
MERIFGLGFVKDAQGKTGVNQDPIPCFKPIRQHQSDIHFPPHSVNLNLSDVMGFIHKLNDLPWNAQTH